ncbi:MAG: TIGR01440 family protein [Clostridia bacterium]|nr:TIGR01440 family protein [Clostridia bacterium]
MNTEFKLQAYNLTKELLEQGKLRKGELLVVGCSSSEILGEKIGTHSAPEVGQAVAEGILQACREQKVYLAAQCCEHLNRALIMEREAAERRGYELVNAVPQPKAGGSFATAVYGLMENPVAVEHIKAEAGMDIGGTLIGMHLKEVAVPCRLQSKTLGNALLLAARTRPKFIGGERAHYDEGLK